MFFFLNYACENRHINTSCHEGLLPDIISSSWRFNETRYPKNNSVFGHSVNFVDRSITEPMQ